MGKVKRLIKLAKEMKDTDYDEYTRLKRKAKRLSLRRKGKQ